MNSIGVSLKVRRTLYTIETIYLNGDFLVAMFEYKIYIFYSFKGLATRPALVNVMFKLFLRVLGWS